MPAARDIPPPRTGAAEKDVLRGFLDHLRTAVAAKAQDVPEPQVRTPGVPSGTSLLGLVRHLAHVERFTFLGDRVTDWPATFWPGPTRPSRASWPATATPSTGRTRSSTPAPISRNRCRVPAARPRCGGHGRT